MIEWPTIVRSATGDGSDDHVTLFEVLTPLGFSVRTTRDYWELISTIKHPSMRGRDAEVRATLERPDEVRRSRSDAAVHLFYRADGTTHWVCAVAKRTGTSGFLITAYRTQAIKEGVAEWRR